MVQVLKFIDLGDLRRRIVKFVRQL
jgi:hypothetical protein